MSLLTKKHKLTEQDIDELRHEIDALSKIEADTNTDQIKRLLAMLELTREDTIREFTFKEIDAFDSDAKLWFFMASVRSKLQVIEGIRNQYLSAKRKKESLLEEFNKIVK